MTSGRVLTNAVKLRPATPANLPLLRSWDAKPHVIAASGTDGPFEWETELPRSVPWREFLIAEVDGRAIGVAWSVAHGWSKWTPTVPLTLVSAIVRYA